MAGHRGLRAAGGDTDVPADRHPRRIPGEGTGMTNTHRSTLTPPLRTPGAPAPFGQRPRDWWNGLNPCRRWGVLIPVIVLIYLLPVPHPPILTTEPGTDFQIAMFNVARFALIAIGLNVVVGQAGLLDLGYVGFFA